MSVVSVTNLDMYRLSICSGLPESPIIEEYPVFIKSKQIDVKEQLSDHLVSMIRNKALFLGLDTCKANRSAKYIILIHTLSDWAYNIIDNEYWITSLVAVFGGNEISQRDQKI